MRAAAGTLLLRIGVMMVAAALEVAGDVLIRAGLRGKGVLLVCAGFAVIGSYGVIVNLLPMDFSKLLGGYVGFFAVISVLGGALVFKETVPASTWVGLGVVVVGSLIIQLGSRRDSPGQTSFERIVQADATRESARTISGK